MILRSVLFVKSISTPDAEPLIFSVPTREETDSKSSSSQFAGSNLLLSATQILLISSNPFDIALYIR